MWSPVVHSTKNETGSVPRTRFKHASCVDPERRVVFLLGGRASNIPLKDFWVMNLETGVWSPLMTRGAPLNVQEHSMVYWNDNVYVFGGIFVAADECPLWTYHVPSNEWSRWQSNKNCAPLSRKGHTAVVYDGRMFVYGGYQDMRGSLGEMWQFTFETNSWRLIHGNRSTKSSEVIPAGRHGHSSVVFDQAIWVYGGMTDLTERSDLWRFDLVTMKWSSIKCRPFGPGPLHGHSAVRVRSHMLVIGGEKQGNLSDEVWRFHFTTETWERLETRNPRPTARTQLTTVALTGSFFASNDETAETGKKDEELATNQNHKMANNHIVANESGPTSIGNVNKSRPPLFGGKSQGGYQLVKTKEDEEAATDLSHLTPWLTKSSTYSLLSNVSTDSFLSEMGDERPPSQMVKLESCPSRRAGHLRSESVQNFTSSAARSSAIPRSMTTVRFNPFDPNKDVSNDVKREDTFDFTTSDYASEVDEPFVGISNPVYTEFASSVADGEDLLAGEHRNFAQALNPSLMNKTTLNRASRLRHELLSQLLRLNMMNERTSRPSTNVITPMNSLDEDSNEQVNQVSSIQHPSSIQEEVWSILMLGGREPVQLTIFDRPLSIWMFKV